MRRRGLRVRAASRAGIDGQTTRIRPPQKEHFLLELPDKQSGLRAVAAPVLPLACDENVRILPANEVSSCLREVPCLLFASLICDNMNRVQCKDHLRRENPRTRSI